MRGPEAPARRELFLSYRAFYRGGGGGAEGAPLAPCTDPALKGQARRLLASEQGEGREAAAPSRRRFDVRRVAESCRLRRKGERRRRRQRRVLPGLSRAFEFLERLCVNLFLSPWRKEIRSLKTFTGNFVYCLHSVLPEEVVESLLGEIGYVPTSPTEFSLVKRLTEEEAEEAAFELFLARMKCEALLETPEDPRDGSDLVDALEKSGQKRCSPEGNREGGNLPSQREERMNAGGENEAEERSLGPCSAYWTQDKAACGRSEEAELRSEFGLGCPVQPEHNTSQRNQEDAFSTSRVKSSDSEDFLIKYSDIVIGQKPLQFTELPPKVSDDDGAQAGTRLGPPANEGRPFALLSPDASGPQALAILNDGPLSSSQPYDGGGQDSGRKTTESKLCDAVHRLNVHGSDPTDQPKELKEHSVLARNVSGERQVRDVFCNKKLSRQGNGLGKLRHPVEETAQAELTNGTSKGGVGRPDHSETKLADATGGDGESFVNLYSATDLFCNIAACECPTVGSSGNRLLGSTSGLREAGGHFSHAREQLNSCCTAAADTSYHGGIPGGIWCQAEGGLLHASTSGYDACVAPVDETNPEGYIVLNKDD